MSKPIKIFTSNKQFYECCKYWQHKLFLDNWFIKFKLTADKLYLNDEEVDGVCEISFNTKESVITIYNGENHNTVFNYVGELTVIHELLHLKNEYLIDKDINGENENTFHRYIFHQSLEIMARSLLMVRYNLDYDYFTL